jgi:regulator of protease activity HflC (stomatin/prohibitin superfamily)
MQTTMMMRHQGGHGFSFGYDELTPVRVGRRVVVHQWQRAVLFRRGALVEVLEPGAHRRWQRGYALRTVDVRPWVLTVPTQEVPTADGVTVKVTVVGRVRVDDPTAFVIATQDATAAVYLAAQIAVREVIARTTVDELLAGRGDAAQLTAALRGVEDTGLAVESLEVKDIVLPSELKRAQAEVLLARAEGHAALERARGETAALRSLANAARLAADNPALLQLRLLQQLGDSTGHTVVLGASPLSLGS